MRHTEQIRAAIDIINMLLIHAEGTEANMRNHGIKIPPHDLFERTRKFTDRLRKDAGIVSEVF